MRCGALRCAARYMYLDCLRYGLDGGSNDEARGGDNEGLRSGLACIVVVFVGGVRRGKGNGVSIFEERHLVGFFWGGYGRLGVFDGREKKGGDGGDVFFWLLTTAAQDRFFRYTRRQKEYLFYLCRGLRCRNLLYRFEVGSLPKNKKRTNQLPTPKHHE